MTEEEIRAAVVGDLKPLEGPILLVDYDPAWPALFELENYADAKTTVVESIIERARAAAAGSRSGDEDV